MKQAKTSMLRRLARLAGLAVALLAPPALAAGSAPVPAPADVAGWVSQNTDLAAAQVAIAGPETVYWLEPLGPRLATGEVVALVRTESVTPAWGATHGFRSWDAHVLFDCNAGRMRVIRSATYSEANRQGRPASEARDAGWLSPAPDEPAARLLRAACDPAYDWPLRASVAALAPKASEAAPAASNASSQAAPATATATVLAQAPTPATGEFAIQLARGPFEAGATRALVKARRVLGAGAEGLAAVTKVSHFHQSPRYTALLTGFPSAQAASAACETLVRAGQSCLTRRLPAVALADRERAHASAAASASGEGLPAARGGLYLVQVAHGPFEAGARRALRKARSTLGAKADSLAAATQVSRSGRRRRYTATLAGFASPEAAAQACRTLRTAGQNCLIRTAAVRREPQLVLARLW